MSDISPQWNPEFFGNTMVVNGKTWPYLNVEQRRYRFRLLNGTDSRFLILKMSNGMPFTQIGSEGGYLPKPVRLKELLIAPAERADVIVDFSQRASAARSIILRNVGPDEPFGGGDAGEEFEPADPGTTGQVMQFRVQGGDVAGHERDAVAAQAPGDQAAAHGRRKVRNVSLNELMSIDASRRRRRRTATSSSTRPASRSARRRRRSARGRRPAGREPQDVDGRRHGEPRRGRRREPGTSATSPWTRIRSTSTWCSSRWSSGWSPTR